MARRKVNHATVALLETLLGFAKAGDLTSVFAVYLCRDGSYDSAFETDDLGDLLLQVRTEVIRAQFPVDAVEQAADRALNS